MNSAEPKHYQVLESLKSLVPKLTHLAEDTDCKMAAEEAINSLTAIVEAIKRTPSDTSKRADHLNEQLTALTNMRTELWAAMQGPVSRASFSTPEHEGPIQHISRERQELLEEIDRSIRLVRNFSDRRLDF